MDAEGIKLPPQRQLPEYLTSVVMHNIQQVNKEQSLPLQDPPPEHGALFQLLRRTLDAWCAGARGENPDSERAEWSRQLEALLSGRLMYRGYCDDPRNTDHAWMSTSVYHTHVPDFLGRLLDIDDEASRWRPAGSALRFRFRWIDVDSGLSDYRSLYASHFDFVELCVPFCECGRRQYDQTDDSHPSVRAEEGPAEAEPHAQAPPELQRARSDVWDLAHGSYAQSPPDTPKWRAVARRGAYCGEVQFLGKSAASLFIRARVASESDVRHVRVVLGQIGLLEPDALIAVTGGAQDFAMDERTTELVFSGILRAAITAGACITDGGTDAGVMKLLGEAVERNGHRVDIVGVAGWGIVIGRDCMARRGGAAAAAGRAFYSKAHPNWAGGAGLDPNHRYFLLVDNGSAGSFGTEIEARAKLEGILRDPKAFRDFNRIVDMAHKFLMLPKKSAASEEDSDAALKELRNWAPSELMELHKYLCEIASDSDFGLADIAKSILKKYLEAPEETAPSSGEEESPSQVAAGIQVVPCRDKHSIREYLRKISMNGSVQQQLPESAAGSESDARQSAPDAPIDSDYTVERCFKCEGSYRDNITLNRYLNSVSCAEYNRWFKLQSKLKGQSAAIVCKCTGCGKSLSSDEVTREQFYPCQEARCSERHYFFRSRVLDMRQKGRDRIICDCCRGRTKLDQIIGKFVPGVLVVVQGGVGTIRTVASTNAETFRADLATTLEQSKERCTPIVVVEGSGKAADFIAATWRHMHEGDRKCYGCPRSSCIAWIRRFKTNGKFKVLLPASCPVIEAEHRRCFGDGISIEDRIQQVSWIIEACRRKETFTLYNPSTSDAGIDFAIMSAICDGTLCDGQPLTMIQQFQMAIDWNLADKEVLWHSY